MKLLFVTAHYGFLRNFESALRELAGRGHRLRLCCDRLESMGGNEIVERLERDFANFSVVQTPRHKKGLWHAYARGVRLCLDYLRYLTPEFAAAPKLRQRAGRQVPRFIVRAARLPFLRSQSGASVLRRLFRLLERAVPVSSEIRSFIAAEAPDAVLVTPLLYFGSDQVDYVRAARNLGVPSMLCVGSWDHLTTKGMIHEVPDRVTVWNPMQRLEAAQLHGVDPDRVMVTGAQSYDHWFDQRPRTDAREFRRRVGLDPDQPYVLYLCSSIFIAPTEREGFFESWLDALRGRPDLREIGVLVRPHPQNASQWADFESRAFGNTAIWPREGANPVGPDSKADYFDSMYHADVVVGINSSGMIESAILGRPVHTVLEHAFSGTQGGTLHFQHLVSVNGGLLHTSATLEEHVERLSAALASGRAPDRRSREFVAGFVRPAGLDKRSTDLFGDAVEELGGLELPAARTRPWWGPVLTPLTAPLALVAQVAFLMQKGEGQGLVRRLGRALAEFPRLMWKRMRSGARMSLHRWRKRVRGGFNLMGRTARRGRRAMRRGLHGLAKRARRGMGRLARIAAMGGRRIAKAVRKIGKLVRVAAWHVLPSSRPRE